MVVVSCLRIGEVGYRPVCQPSCYHLNHARIQASAQRIELLQTIFLVFVNYPLDGLTEKSVGFGYGFLLVEMCRCVVKRIVLFHLGLSLADSEHLSCSDTLDPGYDRRVPGSVSHLYNTMHKLRIHRAEMGYMSQFKQIGGETEAAFGLTPEKHMAAYLVVIHAHFVGLFVDHYCRKRPTPCGYIHFRPP